MLTTDEIAELEELIPILTAVGKKGKRALGLIKRVPEALRQADNDPRLLQSCRILVDYGWCPGDVGAHDLPDDCPIIADDASCASTDCPVPKRVACVLQFFESGKDMQTCRVCGCTDDHACETEHGEGCHWVEPDLCSECAKEVKS